MNISTVLNNKTQMFDTYLNTDIINLLDYTFEIPQVFEYNILTIDAQYIMRPDLISLDAYGDTMYADIICKLNGVNAFEINDGMDIILPAPEYIMNFVRQPDAVQPEIDEEYNRTIMPIAKTKAQKRRANEAIIGDKRFNIDPVNGIVVY